MSTFLVGEGVMGMRIAFLSASWRSATQECLGDLSFPFEELYGDFSLNSSCARNQLTYLVSLEKIKIRIECLKYFTFLGNGIIKLLAIEEVLCWHVLQGGSRFD